MTRVIDVIYKCPKCQGEEEARSDALQVIHRHDGGLYYLTRTYSEDAND